MTTHQLLNQSGEIITPETEDAANHDYTYHGALVAAMQLQRRGMARAHLIVARVLLGGLALQIFFAGLALFGVYSFLPHAILGPIVIGGSFVLPLLAHKGQLGRTIIMRSWILVGLMCVQGLLIDASRYVLPAFGAFHPLNAMLLVLVTYSLARPNHDVF